MAVVSHIDHEEASIISLDPLGQVVGRKNKAAALLGLLDIDPLSLRACCSFGNQRFQRVALVRRGLNLEFFQDQQLAVEHRLVEPTRDLADAVGSEGVLIAEQLCNQLTESAFSCAFLPRVEERSPTRLLAFVLQTP